VRVVPKDSTEGDDHLFFHNILHMGHVEVILLLHFFGRLLINVHVLYDCQVVVLMLAISISELFLNTIKLDRHC
jgi:hypothetical protein